MEESASISPRLGAANTTPVSQRGPFKGSKESDTRRMASAGGRAHAMSEAPSLSDHTAPTVLASRLQMESCNFRVGCPALSAEGRWANAAGSVSEVSSTASLRTAFQKAASQSTGQPSWPLDGAEECAHRQRRVLSHPLVWIAKRRPHDEQKQTMQPRKHGVSPSIQEVLPPAVAGLTPAWPPVLVHNVTGPKHCARAKRHVLWAEARVTIHAMPHEIVIEYEQESVLHHCRSIFEGGDKVQKRLEH
eukprot:scaffold131513_cov63-Phaeocystis_antarctica.AAC.2